MGVIVLDGKYQGKDLYVQSGPAKDGVGFCVYLVMVNEKVTDDAIAASAFEIDLHSQDLQVGDSVTVKIYTRDQCLGAVKVLNPEVLNP